MKIVSFNSQNSLRTQWVFLYFLLSSLVSACSTGPKSLPVIMGPTSEHSTQFSVLSHQTDDLELVAVEEKSLRLHFPVHSKQFERPHSPWKIDHALFKGLSSEKNYFLRVSQKHEDGTREIVDQRRFQPLQPNKNTLTFAIASCMDDSLQAVQKTLWHKVKNLKPDLVLMIGDNVYADRGLGYQAETIPQVLWDRHVETRNSVAFFRFDPLIPVLSIWDDHDYGVDNGDRTYSHKEQSLKTFKAFFPQTIISSGMKKGPGLSYSFLALGHRFIFLDNRFFRDPGSNPKGSHWGRRQEKWLESLLKQRTIPTYLIQGDQFIGNYHTFESLQRQHPEAFNRLRQLLIASRSPVVLISGDRHRSEVSRFSKNVFGYETFEITSSPIHAKTFPGHWKQYPNPDQLAGYEESSNFVLISSKAEKNKLNLNVKAYSEAIEPEFQLDLQVKR